MLRSLPLASFAALLGGTALADVPRVAADIAPVHSLVARVMGELGDPALVVPAGASPHEYSLRPSEAAALQEADLVFWVGETLTPWLGGAVETLAGDATVTALLDVEGVTLLEFREDALFEAHGHGDDDHDHGHDDDHGHGHDHADDHGHDDDPDHGHDDDHGHAHGAEDPHAWLSPDNGVVWLNAIAGRLSAADPENAGTYFANAAAAIAELDALRAEIDATLDPVRDRRFIVFHDAYQYFEQAFDIPAAGAISLSDAAEPSPARIAEIQTRLREEGVDCVLAEPQFNPAMVATVLDGTEAGTGVLDPLGSELAVGPDLYPQLLRNLAAVLADCS
jgi:zinc transport system substrate-binding protein